MDIIFITAVILLLCWRVEEPNFNRKNDLDSSGFRDVTPFAEKDVPR